MNKRALLFAGLGIFAAGLLAGVVGMALFQHTRMTPVVRMEKNGPVAFFMDRLTRHLDLSAAQQRTLRPIVADVIHSIEESRAPCLRAEEDAIQAGNDRVISALSPEQAKKFSDFMERAKERRKKFLEQHQ